jgi:hypothetical protein
MKRRKALRFWILSLALGLCSLPAHAVKDYADPSYDQRGEYDRQEFEYDESLEKPWQESQPAMQALPADANLLRAEVDRLPPGLQLYIDGSSLTLDENDGVLRFWLVLKSDSGAYNATYEGLRCETSQYKVYAYGNPSREPKVRAAPQPEWKDFRGYNLINYRDELAKTLLCNAGLSRPVAVIIATLKGHRDYIHPALQNDLGF